MRILGKLCLLTVGLFTLWNQRALALPSDNFDDNTTGPTWTPIIDSALQLNITETNQRLEATSVKTSTDPNLDALYLSTGSSGFALSTAQDFKMRIDYAMPSTLGAGSTSGSNWNFALDFGFGTTANGDDSFAAAIAWAPVFGFPVLGLGYAYRVNDAQTTVASGLPASTGTLFMTYTQSNDTITVSTTGYNDASPPISFAGLVHGQWNASQLLVSFGTRGHGVDMPVGSAFLDNFVVDAGSVIALPEPTIGSLAIFSLPMIAARRRRR